MNDKVSSWKHVEELLEEIMREEKRRISYGLVYGGQLCTQILRNIVGHAMFVKGLGGRREGMNFL